MGEGSLEVCEVDKMEIGGGWRRLGEENVAKHTCNCGFAAQPLVHEGQIDRTVSHPCGRCCANLHTNICHGQN